VSVDHTCCHTYCLFMLEGVTLPDCGMAHRACTQHAVALDLVALRSILIQIEWSETPIS